MEALTVTKDTTGVLSGEKMAECAFGLLCAAFAEQIMARTGFHEGMYRQVALELLQEGEADAAQPAQNVFNIDLSLILQAIRSEAEKNRARPATQKLIERVIHIKETQSVPARQTQAPRETSLTGRNAFSQTPPAGWTASSRPMSLQMNALPGGQPPLSGETAGNRTPQASWPSFIRNFRRNDALKSRPTALPYDPRKPRAQALAPRRAGEAAKTFGLTHAKEASLQPDGGNARRTPLLTGEQAFLKAESTPQPSVPAVSKSLQPEELALRETQDTEEQKTQQAERRNVPAADKKPEKTADATAESRSNRKPDGQTAKAAGAAPAAPTAEAKSATLQARDIRVAPVSGETAGDAASGKVPQTPAPEEGIPYTLAEQIISAGIEDLTYAQTEKATAATEAQSKTPPAAQPQRESSKKASSPEPARREDEHKASQPQTAQREEEHRASRPVTAHRKEEREATRSETAHHEEGRKASQTQPARQKPDLAPQSAAENTANSRETGLAQAHSASERTAQPETEQQTVPSRPGGLETDNATGTEQSELRTIKTAEEMGVARRDIRSASLAAGEFLTDRPAGILNTAFPETASPADGTEADFPVLPPQEMTFPATEQAPVSADETRREARPQTPVQADAATGTPKRGSTPSEPHSAAKGGTESEQTGEKSAGFRQGIAEDALQRASRDIRSIQQSKKTGSGITAQTPLPVSADQSSGSQRGYENSVPSLPMQELDLANNEGAPASDGASTQSSRPGRSVHKADSARSDANTASRAALQPSSSHSHAQEGRSAPAEMDGKPQDGLTVASGRPSILTAEPEKRAGRDIRSIASKEQSVITGETPRRVSPEILPQTAMQSHTGEHAPALPPQELAYAQTEQEQAKTEAATRAPLRDLAQKPPSAQNAHVPRSETTQTPPSVKDAQAKKDGEPAEKSSPARASALPQETVERTARDVRSVIPQLAGEPAQVQGTATGLTEKETTLLQGQRGAEAPVLPPQELAYTEPRPAPGEESQRPARTAQASREERKARRTQTVKEPAKPTQQGKRVPAERIAAERGRQTAPADAHHSAASQPLQSAKGLTPANRDIRTLSTLHQTAEEARLSREAHVGAPASIIPEQPIAQALQELIFSSQESSEHAFLPKEPKKPAAGGIAAGLNAASTAAAQTLPRQTAEKEQAGRTAWAETPQIRDMRALRHLPLKESALTAALANAFAAHTGKAASENLPFGEELLHPAQEETGAAAAALRAMRPKVGRSSLTGGRTAGSAAPNAAAGSAPTPSFPRQSPFTWKYDAGQSAKPAETSGTQAAAASGATFSADAPLELAYGPSAQDFRQSGTQAANSSAGFMDSEYVGSLPVWAQRFLKGGTSDSFPTAEGARTMASSARDIGVLPKPQAAQEQIDWSAPVPRRPAEMNFHKKEDQQEKPSAPAQMSEAELKRTADKIYRMLEDRIRRERRRLGL